MRLLAVAAALGSILEILGLSMLGAMAWSMFYQEPEYLPLLTSSIITFAAGLLMSKLHPGRNSLTNREALVVVGLGWLLAAFFGSLPYLLSGVLNSFADAFFETMSGFTTTGASVLTEIEAVPRGILFWRSLTHWLGGMGIIILFVAVLGHTGIAAQQMLKAESPGPMTEKLGPRIKQTAQILWQTYVLLSVLEIILLCLAGMTLFDAMAHTFGTVATGGFSTKNASIGYYQSPLIQWIVIAFMYLAGVNFSLYYLSWKGKDLRTFWRSEEFRLYTIMLVAVGFLTSFVLAGAEKLPLEQTVRTAFFQVVSIMTTTGYATTDFNLWSPVLQYFLVLLMFIGGSAGSTGGSVKVSRYLLLFKQAGVELKRMLHPRAVVAVSIDRKAVPAGVITTVQQFFFLFLLIFLVGTLVMIILGLDMVSAATAVLASLGNVGPGLEAVGPASNYSSIPAAGKYFLSLLMLLGRLEIFPVLMLFLPATWNDR